MAGETGIRYPLAEPTLATATGTLLPESCDTERYRLSEPLYIFKAPGVIPACPDKRMR